MGVSRHLRNIREGVRDATAAIRKGLVSEEESACKEESGMEESSPPTPVDLSSCELQSRSVEVALECVGGSGTGNFRCVSQDGDWWVHGGTKGHLVLALSERPTLWIWSSNKQARPKLCAASYFLGSMAPPVGSDQWSPAAALTAIQYFASWQGQQDDDGCYFSIDFNDVPAPKAGSLFLLLHLSGNHGASYIAVNRIKAFGSRRVISCLPQPPVMADVHHVVGNDDMEWAPGGLLTQACETWGSWTARSGRT
ncbi:MAG: hypothetical protein KVP17_001071 [Porospora cf. gigantea B]|uniref:uncharacterized protein n=1 Tax=Porospora cf. gigantea B TaxID=2853592 RepID=UPI003571E061|nr:MAG: hypothetical protein KVP17_001071 [Porospora cf. gigantea B]